MRISAHQKENFAGNRSIYSVSGHARVNCGGTLTIETISGHARVNACKIKADNISGHAHVNAATIEARDINGHAHINGNLKLSGSLGRFVQVNGTINGMSPSHYREVNGLNSNSSAGSIFSLGSGVSSSISIGNEIIINGQNLSSYGNQMGVRLTSFSAVRTNSTSSSLNMSNGKITTILDGYKLTLGIESNMIRMNNRKINGEPIYDLLKRHLHIPGVEDFLIKKNIIQQTSTSTTTPSAMSTYITNYSEDLKQFLTTVERYKSKQDGKSLSDLFAQYNLETKHLCPITYDAPDKPVKLHGQVFDLDSLMKLETDNDGRREHPVTRIKFLVVEIQAARDIFQEMQEQIESAQNTTKNTNSMNLYV